MDPERPSCEGLWLPTRNPALASSKVRQGIVAGDPLQRRGAGAFGEARRARTALLSILAKKMISLVRKAHGARSWSPLRLPPLVRHRRVRALQRRRRNLHEHG